MSNRALLVGVNNFQNRSEWRLNGCVNDTLDMQALLKADYGFGDENVRLLHDEDATGQGIRSGLAWLLSDYDNDGHDVRIFHFASHGTQVDDQSGDEYECIDEVIVAHDHSWDNPFRDDDLRDIFAAVPENVHFAFVADCCHSGSIQRYIVSGDGEAQAKECRNRTLTAPKEVEQRIARLVQKRDAEFDDFAADQLSALLQGLPQDQWQDAMRDFMADTRQRFKENKFNVVQVDRHILLAACQDRQTAADAWIDGQYRGAFTWSLTKTLRQSNGNLNYRDLIQGLAVHLTDYPQKPQLECTERLSNEIVFRGSDSF